MADSGGEPDRVKFSLDDQSEETPAVNQGLSGRENDGKTGRSVMDDDGGGDRPENVSGVAAINLRLTSRSAARFWKNLRTNSGCVVEKHPSSWFYPGYMKQFGPNMDTRSFNQTLNQALTLTQ